LLNLKIAGFDFDKLSFFNQLKISKTAIGFDICNAFDDFGSSSRMDRRGGNGRGARNSEAY